MGLRANNTRAGYRPIWAGRSQTVTLLKRNDDLQEGTVTALTIFQAIQGQQISRTGEIYLHDMVANHHNQWGLPFMELHRQGVNLISAADRIIDKKNRVWQPEATTVITNTQYDNFVWIDCLRVQ